MKTNKIFIAVVAVWVLVLILVMLLLAPKPASAYVPTQYVRPVHTEEPVYPPMKRKSPSHFKANVCGGKSDLSKCVTLTPVPYTLSNKDGVVVELLRREKKSLERREK